eukprot:scaffold5684_cov169-Amphora_coffeaeformis.AAC.18
MKGPISFSLQGGILENKRSALAPRNNKHEAKDISSTSEAEVKHRLLESVGMGDPWSEGAALHATAPVGEVNPSVPGQKSTAAALPDSTPASSRPVDDRNFGAPLPSHQQQQTPTDGSRPVEETKQRSSSASGGRNKMDRPPSAAVPPRRAPSPPTRIPRVNEGVPLVSAQNKHHERPKDASGLLPLAAMKSHSGRRISDPAEQEQMLFEQRLCEDALGVAVRKINQYGKANLRYVKCINLEDFDGRNSTRSTSSRSAGSWGRRRSPSSRGGETPTSAEQEKARRALVWGKKKDVQIQLNKFTIVRKGKATDRARRNPSPSSRILSILTKDPNHPSLDIEAPTRMDRDKFARAFARFLDIPLESEDSPSVHSADVTPATLKTTPEPSASSSAAGDFAMPLRETVESPGQGKPPQNPKKTGAENGLTEIQAGGFWQGAVAAASAANSTRDMSNNSDYPSSVNVDDTNHDDTSGPEAVVELKNEPVQESDDASVVSSLTGHGYDQELVEELHQALNELRAELEESRAEAARAVKVAEQAIQSAEKSSSAEWQNTVTHKAAEAAAMAQKKSAEAMAKQRLAEERLDGERRTAAFWRKQSEIAESEAGFLQTRAAAAEVQRAAFEEQIDSERRLAASKIEAMKVRLDALERQQQASAESTVQRNRSLEVEVESLRRDLQMRREQGEDVENAGGFQAKSGKRRVVKAAPGKKKNIDSNDHSETKALLLANATASNSKDPVSGASMVPNEVARLQSEAADVRLQYEMLRKTTVAELESLPSASKIWTEQVSQTLSASQDEIARLRSRVAVESASRRKLLHEVQDLRGIVRVYCRPRPALGSEITISMPSQETLVLHREKFGSVGTGPMSFDFDRIFDPNASQREVFTEIQDVLLSVLDGYKVCLMAYGQSGAGKTKTLLGDITTQNNEIFIENHGVQLQVMRQLISIAEHRSDRFKDTFKLTIVEVNNERLSDLLAGTRAAAARGQVVVAETKRKGRGSVDDDASSSRPAKLEIRTDVHGETVVQGALSLEIDTFEEALQIWEEALANRRNRLVDQEVDLSAYEASSHVIATVHVTSANIATGHGTIGKLQFVDLAGADLVQHKHDNLSIDSESAARGISNDAKFVHRSLETLGEVAIARSQFVRSVPYRNSTLTHLLRDSLEADTKVLFFACISPDPKDLQETAQALRFARRMRQVNVGKATKHTITSP